MKKIKLTCAHAIVKHLISQKILIDGKKEALFAGAFGILDMEMLLVLVRLYKKIKRNYQPGEVIMNKTWL
jgi:TPP-dependent trihydroxycyclohexane-1,2-dione (THcHDO) dehydratase